MLMRALLCLLLPASLLGAQDTPGSPAPERDLGLDLRVGFSRPVRIGSRFGDSSRLTGSVPTFNVEGRIFSTHGLSLHLTGEALPMQPTRVTGAPDCLFLCANSTHTSALQGGIAARAALGATYATVSIAERGAFTTQDGGCGMVCSYWPTYGNTALYSVRRIGIGIRPRGSGVRPIAEASLSFSHPAPGVDRRDLELGAGVAF
jgi:hypothetical protein